MEKKKGFTLIEVIVSITLLAVIGITIGLSFNKLNNSQSKEDEEFVVSKIKSAADVYLTGNESLLNELYSNKSYLVITLKDLKDAGLITESLKDPNSGKELEDKTEVMASLDANGTVRYDYPINKNQKEYMQLLNVYLEKDEVVNCKVGENTYKNTFVNSEGKYDFTYHNYTCDWNTNNAKKPGTYKVNYTYTLSDGSKKSAVRNFIVQKPLAVKLEGKDDKSKIIVTDSWTNTYFNITAVLDRLANVKYEWLKDGVSVNNNTSSVRVTNEGISSYTLKYTVYNINNETNISYTGEVSFKAKLELANTIKNSLYTPVVSGDQTWHNLPITLTVTSKEPISGIKEYKYCISALNGICTASLNVNNKNISIRDLGKNIAHVVMITNAGNISNEGIGYAFYDNVAPIYQSGSASGVISANFTDNHSGINSIYYYSSTNSSNPSINDASWTTSSSMNYPSCGNTYYYYTYAKDNAGNASPSSLITSNYGGSCCYGCSCTDSCTSSSSHTSGGGGSSNSNSCNDACRINQISHEINATTDQSKRNELQSEANQLRDKNDWTRVDSNGNPSATGDHTVDKNGNSVTWESKYGSGSSSSKSSSSSSSSSSSKSNSSSSFSKAASAIGNAIKGILGGKKR